MFDIPGLQYYGFLFMSIVVTAIGQLAFKLFALRGDLKFLILALSFFIQSPMFIVLSLLGLSMDVVFMADALTIALVFCFSVVVLKERLTTRSIRGLSFILMGIIIYNLDL